VKFGILTSGGDGPGMNAIIRAFNRDLLYHGHQAIGIMRGYAGLIEADFITLGHAEVGNIIQKGGTILKTSRCLEFMEKTGRTKAFANLKKHKVQGLCVVGGDGSFKGALKLFEEYQIPIVGIPGTIDNDISGTEYTIGHETAVFNAMEAIDKIRDTALSHDRVFLVEVMGKNSSALCQRIAACTGAEMAIHSELNIPEKEIVSLISRGQKRGKKSSIFVVAENETPGRSYQIQKLLAQKYQINSHVCILGHIQRGGSPVAEDRIYGSQMGSLAAELLIKLAKQKTPQAHACVVRHQKVISVPLIECSKKISRFDDKLQELLSKLSV